MRIAIVSAAGIAAEVLRVAVSSVAGYRIAWIARDGAEAVERCRQDTPDLILMELIMPVLNGVEATRRIMNQTPCAILVVTPDMEAHQSKVFEALGAGAVDVAETPLLCDGGHTHGIGALKFKIASVARLVSEGRRGLLETSALSIKPPQHDPSDSLIAIGASAGGPAATAAILSKLPRDFPAAIVVVQHVDWRFVPTLATWLNQRSALDVRVARAGESPGKGTVLIAGTNHHLVFTNPQRLGYTPESGDGGYRPSIDVFFQSLVHLWKGRAIGVLLTGMGRDGAAGLKSMRDAGILTIGQDRESCVVYGMPKAAAEMGAVSKVLSLDTIAAELIRSVSAMRE